MNFEEIYARMAQTYASLAGFEPDDASDAGIRLRVLAGEIYTALCALETVRDAAFPQTAAGEALDLHAGERGLARKPAVRAKGTLTFSRGTPLTYDVEIPCGTVCAASGAAAEFETTEAAVLAAGELSVTAAAQAVTGGRAFNAAVHAVDTLVTPPAGIESVRNDTAFSGGSDEESDDALRRRLLASYSVLPNGANSETYRRAALQIPGVEHVNVVPRANGIGTVAVYLYGDRAAVTEETVTAVQTVLDALREINVDVTVAAAEPVSKRVTMYIVPKDGCGFSDVKAICEEAVRAYFDTLSVGDPFVAAAVVGAIMQTGAVKNCSLPASVTDYAAAADEIVVPGEITALQTQL
ncbi:MAG: baseplate J/gp47 family protein [Hominenteromicrobium sp.]